MDPNTRQLGRRGLRGQLPGYIEQPREAKQQRTRSDSELTEKLPERDVVSAYFHRVQISAVTVPTGQHLWYGLRRVRIEQDYPECQLVGYRGTMLPGDTTGITLYSQTGIAWCDRRGQSGRIVIGRNLPIQEGSWTVSAAALPGIDIGAGTGTPSNPSLVSDRSLPRYIAAEPFPTGGYADTTPNFSRPGENFGAFVHTFQQGDTLDVALVVYPSASVVAGGYLYGYADFRLFISPLDGIGGRGTP